MIRYKNIEYKAVRASGSVDFRADAGFTLIELLIALVLSTIIFVNAYQVLSNLIQYQVRASQQQGSQLDRWLLINLLSEIIEKSASQADLHYRYSRTVAFTGESDRLTLISRAYSTNFDLPGYRVYRLFERDGSLRLAYRAYDVNYRKNHQYETDTGLAIGALRFEYLSPEGWVDSWEDAKTFPGQIRVRAEMPGGQPIEVVRGTSLR